MLYVWGRGEVHTELWWGNMTKSAYVEDQNVDGRIILHCILNNIYGRATTGLIWLRIEKKWCALVNVVMNLRVS
jgi:hypothetical protein